MRTMRASLTVIIVLLVLAQGCASEEPTERVPPPTYPPASEPLPTVQAKTKWDLWTNGTRLRGADIHPCRVYDGEACVERTTRQDLVDLRNLGANLVNASYPGAFTIEAPYEADAVALGYLDDLIGWAEEVGVYVVIHFPTGPGRSEGAIHQDRNLSLARHSEDSNLADPRGDINGAIAQPFGLKHHPNLQAESGMAKLVQFHHHRRSHEDGRVAIRNQSSPAPCGSFSSTSPVIRVI